MTTYPIILAGQRLTADLLTSAQTLLEVKPTTTSRASTTTLSDDPDLVLTLPRVGVWSYVVWLNYTGGTLGSSDLKVRMDYSGTSSFDVFGVQGINTTSTSQFTASGGTAAGPGLSLGTNGGNFLTAYISGHVVTTTTGDLSLQWAQNTSSGTSTNLRQGCHMRAWQIS